MGAEEPEVDSGIDDVQPSPQEPPQALVPQMSQSLDKVLVSQPKKKKKKVKDTIVISIPLHVTADLGIAMRRVRMKRIQKLRAMCPSLFQTSFVPKTASEEEAVDDDEIEEEDLPKKAKTSGKNPAMDPVEEEYDALLPKRSNYGSVLDYLEAKYVRGVMIDDEKLNKNNKKEDTISVLSGESSNSRSVYSDSSGGFLDDSLLRTEVAQQVMASSAYGTTKIEAESKKIKQRDDDNDTKDRSEEEEEEEDKAFFVNVGDLEMEDGWEEEEIRIEPDNGEGRRLDKTKKKGKEKSGNKRKRTSKDSISATVLGEKNAHQESTPKSDGRKETPDSKQASKTENNQTRGASLLVNAPFDEVSVASMSKISSIPKLKKKAKTDASPAHVGSLKKAESDSDSSNNSDESDNLTSAKSTTFKPNITASSAEAITTAGDDKILQERKKHSEELLKNVQKTYKTAVDEIEKLTEEHLPRKPSTKGKMVKVSIVIPPTKNGGDNITFSNPHVPGQKLKVKIPENGKPGGKFVVSVPIPAVRKLTTDKPNTFPREARDALDEYSQAHDDWCHAEALYRGALPKPKGKKQEPFKAAVERLKKFDDMLQIFPKDLQTPIDAVFLRKVVRRARQNAAKRLKTQSNMDSSVASARKRPGSVSNADRDAPPAMMDIAVPGRGTTFPTIKFSPSDFFRAGEGKV